MPTREWIAESWSEGIPVEPVMTTETKRLTFAFVLRYHPGKLLRHPKTVEELRREAVSGLEYAAHSLAQLNLAAPSGDPNLSSAMHATCASFAEAVEFFIASKSIPATDEFSLARHLVVTEAKLKEALTQLRGNPMAARMIAMHSDDARRRAERWRGKGTRGLDMAAPRTRLVLRLLAEMEDRRSNWTDLVCADDGLPESDREAFQTTLHERIREMIALPPLSTATAGSYHHVGLKMLNDATGAGGVSGYERHPAFQRGGEFYGLVNSAKSFAGALGEAWKNVARFAAKGHAK